MGSGKSTVGRLLAKRSGRFFLDTDSLIEMAEGQAIPEIFSNQGEPYFRQLENDLAAWLSQHVNRAVIATGGGFPLHLDASVKLGKNILLQAGFETIRARVHTAAPGSRPLFTDEAQAKALFDQRYPAYLERAEVVIDADRPAESVVDSILGKLALS